MTLTTTTGIFIFHLGKDKPLGTGVIFEESQEVGEGCCCRKGCDQVATQVLEQAMSSCSPFGFNTAYIYEDERNRDSVRLNVCENCREDPKDGFIFLVNDEERFGSLRRCTFTTIK